ncbi:hypothetical protein WJX74_000713 [Apatococcus lobatus]|uniref:Uncharacterized protein n=1 Tax=Apatococcus lobatus TaxID=904363 RepID=A0AAW1RIZ8_9CHLO
MSQYEDSSSPKPLLHPPARPVMPDISGRRQPLPNTFQARQHAAAHGPIQFPERDQAQQRCQAQHAWRIWLVSMDTEDLGSKATAAWPHGPEWQLLEGWKFVMIF